METILAKPKLHFDSNKCVLDTRRERERVQISTKSKLSCHIKHIRRKDAQRRKKIASKFKCLSLFQFRHIIIQSSITIKVKTHKQIQKGNNNLNFSNRLGREGGKR